MSLRAPRFWQSRGAISSALLPVAWAYSAIATSRWRRTEPIDCGLPVVCIGNLEVGGAGKTPLAIDLLVRLQARGLKPFALTRGYGGKRSGPLLVDPARHDWRQVGDEARLLASHAPTIVSGDRVAGALLARQQGADIIVMDDGFQNPGLKKTASLLVIDADYGLGNGRLFPAGPLREAPGAALARCDAIVLVGDSGGLPDELSGTSLPLLKAAIRTLNKPLDLKGRRVIAFAGIGRPKKFFDGLRRIGAELVSAVAFPDHHPYRAADLALILSKAADLDALAVTTEKDRQRLDPELAERVLAVPAAFIWQQEAEIDALLDRILDRQ